MNESLRQKIRDLAALANPTSEQMQHIIDGWDIYFWMVSLGTDRQQAIEFDTIMRARVYVGIISIVAPSPAGRQLPGENL